MNTPISRPTRVIGSCKTMSQVTTASLYALYWCKRKGLSPDSSEAKYLFGLARGKLRILAHDELAREAGNELGQPFFDSEAQRSDSYQDDDKR